MTIRKRLFWSNLLMILVPVLSAALVGIFCVVFIWFSLVNGAGLDLGGQESFERTGAVIAEAVEHCLEHGSDFSAVRSLLDSNGLRLEIRSQEESIFEYGTMEGADLELIKAADLLGGESSLTANGRRLYTHREQIRGTEYTLYLLGGTYSEGTALDLKTALVLSVLVVMLAIVLSVCLTNRFLTTFVFKKIEGPLDILTGGVHEIRDGNLNYRIQYYLETIKAKAENLAHMVSQLFLFSQMELGEYPEHPCLLRLDTLILEIVSTGREDYEKGGLTIHTALTPAKIYADPLQVRRILTNILENSLKYKDKEKGTVWIRLERTEPGCRLIFLDDGPGVSEESLPRLFEVFYRSDPSRQKPEKGSGLGLAIVANAVRRMGGTVQAFPGKPRGLGIRIDLPGGDEKHGKNTNY